MKTGVISTAAGIGTPGYSGDGGPARQDSCAGRTASWPMAPTVSICDIGNHRIRRLHLRSGLITPMRARATRRRRRKGHRCWHPPHGPRALARAPNGDLYLALREGNAIYRIDSRRQTLHRIAGTGTRGYSGDGGLALDATLAGRRGSRTQTARSTSPTPSLVVRRVDLRSGVITTALGTGEPGEVPTRAAAVPAAASARSARRCGRRALRRRQRGTPHPCARLPVAQVMDRPGFMPGACGEGWRRAAGGWSRTCRSC